jgi:hypothetical protein
VLSPRVFWYCKIFSWVQRSTLQLGVHGREVRKRERGFTAQTLQVKFMYFMHRIDKNVKHIKFTNCCRITIMKYGI